MEVGQSLQSSLLSLKIFRRKTFIIGAPIFAQVRRKEQEKMEVRQAKSKPNAETGAFQLTNTLVSKMLETVL